MPENPILIIAFKFPPYGGVGARRWAKFAKYLAREGYRVHVVTVKYAIKGANAWLQDIDDSRITVHRIPSGFPHNLYQRRYGRSFADRVKNKLKVRLFGLFKYGFWLDEAQYWGRSLLPYCGQLISEHGIVNVMATGAPFSVNYFAAKLKQTNPEINLINDWRDPWNDNPFLGYPRFFRRPSQKRQSVEMEEFALRNSDHVTGVSEGLIELLKRRCPNEGDRFKVISNGFDPDYFDDLARHPDSSRMVLCYIGNLFAGREVPFAALLKAIVELCEERPEFRKEFVLKTYGGFPHGINVDYRRLIDMGNLEIGPRVPPREALQAAKDAFLLLLVNADIFPYLVSAKVYEYIALRRPILAVTSPGALEKIVQGYGFGDIARPNDNDALKAALLDWWERWHKDPEYEPAVAPETIDEFSDQQLIVQLTACFRNSDLS